jgi:hypothetical protein
MTRIKSANKFTKTFLRLAQADIAFYILPFIMLYLVLGTLAQAPLGLYAAQKMYFGSFILQAGPVPLPGFYIFTGLLTCSLLLKFIFFSDWSLNKSGINLTHLGVLVLLTGGLATALTAREGFMALAEGASSPYVYDYHQRELFIFKDDTLLRTIPFGKLQPQNSFDLPFSLKVLEACENCAIEKRADTDKPYNGMARFMALSPTKPGKEPEEDIAGVTFELDDNFYIAFEGMPKPILYKNYKLMFGRQQRLLPFSIQLDDFKKEAYPGMDKARAYSSDIAILENGVAWLAHISMNQPLRYRGYTFYQSSFEQGPGGEVSVFSVVENKGRLFPYIGTILIAAGLILHLCLMTRERNAP